MTELGTQAHISQGGQTVTQQSTYKGIYYTKWLYFIFGLIEVLYCKGWQ